jgi:hypothetical protein
MDKSNNALLAPTGGEFLKKFLLLDYLKDVCFEKTIKLLNSKFIILSQLNSKV